MRLGFLLACLVLGACAPSQPLFDGRTLAGWERAGGRAEYRAENGCIVGETRPNQPNTFLRTSDVFEDFELELEFLVDPRLNSGVQVRSRLRDDGIVQGLQVEIDPSERAWTGGIYDEAGRGWLSSLADKPEASSAFRQGEWNHLRIEARGARIRAWLNGVAAGDYTDSTGPRSGFIALQVHGVGSREDPLAVRWRNIVIRSARPWRGRHPSVEVLP